MPTGKVVRIEASKFAKNPRYARNSLTEQMIRSGFSL
jgi:hypothetical protein